MAPAIPAAKAQLSYPLYACDFDPQNPARVIVGGGGGAGRSGVGNKISVLDSLTPHTLDYSAEIDLSKDEDNITSLAVGPKKGKNILIYAGVNTDPKDAALGKNKHFRVFGLEPPAVSKTGIQTTTIGKMTELSRATLFSSKDKDVYQRVLRLSRPYSNGDQLGAIATGLTSKDPEIVVFDASSSASTVTVRGHLQLEKEASDLDVIQSGPAEYILAYCDDHHIVFKTFSKEADSEDPICVFTAPELDLEDKPPVPSYRALRFITPEFLAIVRNIPGRKGADLLTFRVSMEQGQLKGRITRHFRLPSKVTQATGLAVVNLAPLKNPGPRQGYAQILIAITGQDNSIYLFKVDHQTHGSNSILTQPILVHTLNAVHPLQITGISFSNFIPPVDTSSPPTLKLATVSVGNSLVVHSIPLETTEDNRYVLSLPERRLSFLSITSVLAVLLVALLAIITQSVLELRGTMPPLLGVTNYINPDTWYRDLQNSPQNFHDWFFSKHTSLLPNPLPSSTAISSSASPVHPISHSEFTDSSFASTLAKLRASNSEGHPIIIRAEQDAAEHETNPELESQSGSSVEGLKAHLHDEAVLGPHTGQKWDELTEAQKKTWLRRMRGVEEWGEALPENIFQGVFWSEVAGAVGRAVGGG